MAELPLATHYPRNKGKINQSSAHDYTELKTKTKEIDEMRERPPLVQTPSILARDLLSVRLLPMHLLPRLTLPRLLCLFWQELPDVSHCQEVQHCLSTFFHWETVRDLHMLVSSCFPSSGLSHSLQERRLLVSTTAAGVEEMLLCLKWSAHALPAFVILSLAKLL